MNSAFSQPTHQAAYAPLQPTAEGPKVPEGLDSNSPGHAPNAQHAANVTQPATASPVDSTAKGYGAQQNQLSLHPTLQAANVPQGHDDGAADRPPVNSTTATGYGAQQNQLPLHPTAVRAHDPHGLDVGAPGHTPIPQHASNVTQGVHGATGPTAHPQADSAAAGYAAYQDRTQQQQQQQQPAVLGSGVPQGLGAGAAGHAAATEHKSHPLAAPPINAPTTEHGYHGNTAGGDMVLQVSAPDAKTVHVSGHGTGYTMITTVENGKRLVTIRRGLPGETTNDETDANTQTADEPYVAQVELHQIRANKISIKGMPQIKLKDWLEGRGTSTHKFTESGTTYEWRKSFHGLSRKLELFAAKDHNTRLAWVEKADPAAETGQPHMPGVPPMPAHHGTVTLTVSQRVRPIIDMVVVSFLLVDREKREDPLH